MVELLQGAFPEMVTTMGVPGSVGSSHLSLAVAARRTHVQGEDRVLGLPQPCSFGANLEPDPGEATAVEPALGWPLVPLAWAGGEQEVWGSKAPVPGWRGAQQGESWAPCPWWVPEVCSTVISGLPPAWGSAQEEAKPPRQSWAGEPEQMGIDGSSGQCREGEGRALQGPEEGCSRGAGGREGMRGAAVKKRKDEAHVKGTKEDPGMRDAASSFS